MTAVSSSSIVRIVAHDGRVMEFLQTDEKLKWCSGTERKESKSLYTENVGEANKQQRRYVYNYKYRSYVSRKETKNQLKLYNK